MPYISIEIGQLTAEQKQQLIKRLTATASEITHIPGAVFHCCHKGVAGRELWHWRQVNRRGKTEL